VRGIIWIKLFNPCSCLCEFKLEIDQRILLSTFYFLRSPVRRSEVLRSSPLYATLLSLPFLLSLLLRPFSLLFSSLIVLSSVFP